MRAVSSIILNSRGLPDNGTVYAGAQNYQRTACNRTVPDICWRKPKQASTGALMVLMALLLLRDGHPLPHTSWSAPGCMKAFLWRLGPGVVAGDCGYFTMARSKRP